MMSAGTQHKCPPLFLVALSIPGLCWTSDILPRFCTEHGRSADPSRLALIKTRAATMRIMGLSVVFSQSNRAEGTLEKRHLEPNFIQYMMMPGLSALIVAGSEASAGFPLTGLCRPSPAADYSLHGSQVNIPFGQDLGMYDSFPPQYYQLIFWSSHSASWIPFVTCVCSFILTGCAFVPIGSSLLCLPIVFVSFVFSLQKWRFPRPLPVTSGPTLCTQWQVARQTKPHG